MRRVPCAEGVGLPEDLGSWPPAQATTLVKVLRKSGVSPETSQDGATVRVTVPDEQAEAANAAIAANMDTIAKAARQANEARQAAAERRKAKADRQPPLVMERFARMGPIVGLLLVAFLVVAIVPGPLKTLFGIVAVVGVLWLAGRDSDGSSDHRGRGPRRPGA